MKEMLNKRFDELLKEAQDVLSKNGWDGQEWRSFPSEMEFNKWYASAKNLIEKSCGKSSSYCNQFDALYSEKKGNTYYMSGCIGILQAAYDDLKAGLLEDTKALITAEVFVDFIEQAEYLLKENYKLPAAVLARAVLEDSMRTICKKNNIPLSDKPKIDLMNADLVKAGVYNKNVQKQITAFAGIGNSAAHGKPDEFKEEDVKNMINYVISFNADYLK
ncbi:MAG: hypothetical protein A2231_04980 [Candidatus Firestonebacteria bacterium RIFOXYA2_FULL_40_8]|nr:MAG: hypothetical protein A2231_04980 [Candidatus Firestonebacteria bacterium RIFOXYA2_FULL_40_8]